MVTHTRAPVHRDARAHRHPPHTWVPRTRAPTHTNTRVHACPFTWQPVSSPKSLGMASATLGRWGLCLRAGGLLVCSASSPRLLEKGSCITQDKRPGDGNGTQNITVNTTLSQKHPRAAPATGRKSPRRPPVLGSAGCPRRRIFLPHREAKKIPPHQVLAQGTGGNRPFVTAGPRHAMLPTWQGQRETRRSLSLR